LKQRYEGSTILCHAGNAERLWEKRSCFDFAIVFPINPLLQVAGFRSHRAILAWFWQHLPQGV